MNLKTEVTRKQSTSHFPKNENFPPPDTYHRLITGKVTSLQKKFLKSSISPVLPLVPGKLIAIT